jgi:hypothetical protein
MEKFIKYAWIFIAVSGSFCMLVNLPYEVWEQAYLKEVHQIQLFPLKRIDATNRYIEAIESGKEDLSRGIQPAPPKKYYREIPYQNVKKIGRLYIYDDYPEHDTEVQPEEKKYQKPLYRRDKDNPYILHKVY